MSFETLGLSAGLLHALGEQGYTEPTPIQRRAIPLILQGRDVMAGAQTGTGKTAAFALPMLHRLAETPVRGRTVRRPRALVLVPTRELAEQVGESVRAYARHLPLRSAVIFGGVKMGPQVTQLRRGVDIVVATPGRLLDHVAQGTADLAGVEIVVLDEADRMLDMGFIQDIRRILARLPARGGRQALLFSATFPPAMERLAGELLSDPMRLEAARRNSAAEHIVQVVHPVAKSRKRALLSHMIGSRNWRRVLVFTRTRRSADRLARQLGQDGLQAAAIHGDKSQGARRRALADFKRGRVRVLVATDIAARGLDIEALPHVVNFELPQVAEDYVHRIGRTGRAGSAGTAVSLVSGDEHGRLKAIERVLCRRLPREVLAGYEPERGMRL